MNFPDTRPDPAASICWFLGDFHLLLPHHRPAKTSQLQWSSFLAVFPLDQSSHRNNHLSDRKSTYSKQVPEGHQGFLVPPASPPGMHGHQLCWEIRATDFWFTVRRQEKSEKTLNTAEFLLPGRTPCSCLRWKPLLRAGAAHCCPNKCRTTFLVNIWHSISSFVVIGGQKMLIHRITNLKNSLMEKPPTKALVKLKVLLKNSTWSKSSTSSLTPQSAYFLTCTHTVFAA